MKKQYFIVQLLLLFSLFACNDDEGMLLTGNPVRITGQIAGMEAGEATTRFRGGAGVGMFITDLPAGMEGESFSLSGTRVCNEKYMQSADGLVGDKRAYWMTAERIGIVGYYPWQNSMGSLSGEIEFTVAGRQDTLDGNLPAYQESDFLWARTITGVKTEAAVLLFKHLMSKVVIYLKSDAKLPGDMVGGKVKIQGVETAAKVNLETGHVAANGKLGEVVAAETEMSESGYELAVNAVMVPQTVKEGVQFLEIQTLGGYSYIWRLPEDLILESGKQLTLEVEIVSGECRVNIGDIIDWTESGVPVYGQAVEDLPVFKVFDLYDIDGIRGMVISTNEAGTHGLVMSLDKSDEILWALNEVPNEDTGFSDGLANTKMLLAIDPTGESFPALKWCMDKNPEGVVKWYFPAAKEVEMMMEVVAEDLDFFNQKLEDLGGIPIYYDEDWGETEYYWTSTFDSWNGKVDAGYYGYWGGRITTAMPTEDLYSVRAFYKF